MDYEASVYVKNLVGLMLKRFTSITATSGAEEDQAIILHSISSRNIS